jgi:hypothetical protein
MRRKRKDNRGLETIADVIGRDRMFVKAVENDRSPVSKETWKQIVGPKVADRTKPLRLERETLVVITQSSSWAQELSLLSETILTRLRAAGCPASALRFVTGKIDPARRPKKLLYRHVPRLEKLPGEVADAVSRVEDPDLRRAIEIAAARALALGKTEAPKS